MFIGVPDGPGAAENAADKEDRWSRRAEAASSSAAPNGGASEAVPGERPRLKLQPRTLPLPNGEPSSSAASSSGGAAAVEARRSGSNPFGTARPREDVLREKGVDPIKEALRLEHIELNRWGRGGGGGLAGRGVGVGSGPARDDG